MRSLHGLQTLQQQQQHMVTFHTWNVSHVTNFSDLFVYQSDFNEDISNWNVSNGTNFETMFRAATKFDKDIGSWDVSSGINFTSMFYGASIFNQDISSWDVSSGTKFHHMFRSAEAFNQDISGWDVYGRLDINGQPTNYDHMFTAATKFIATPLAAFINASNTTQIVAEDWHKLRLTIKWIKEGAINRAFELPEGYTWLIENE